MLKSQFSTNVRLLRKYLGLSQQKLADRLQLKRNQIAAYEAGITEPSAQQLIQLAVFFKISTHDLWSYPLHQVFDAHGKYHLHRRLNDMQRATQSTESALQALTNLATLRKEVNADEQQLVQALIQLLQTNQHFIGHLQAENATE
ncbi:MAG: helix-turn-helix transcriptional regulator [Saprospiraceae bacterium]